VNKVSPFREAMKQARLAFKKNEVPIGAVLVQGGKIIARAHNSTEAKRSHLAHAEILVIQKAAKVLRSKYLPHCDLYVTLEPCQMCRAAAKLARIRHIYYAVASPKFGRSGMAYFKTKIKKSKSTEESESRELLSLFFSLLRMRKS